MSHTQDEAQRLLSEERWEEAAAHFTAHLRDTPDDATAHAGLSRCLLAGGEAEAAEREAQHAVTLDPENPDAWLAVAGVALEADRLRTAQTAIGRVLQRAPDAADALALSARIQERQHRWSEAMALAEHGLAFMPGHLECARVRARGLLHEGQIAAARAWIRESLSSRTDDPLTRTETAWTALELGRADEAAREFADVVRETPSMHWARLGLATAIRPLFPLYRPLLIGFVTREENPRGHRLNAAAELAITSVLRRVAERSARLRGLTSMLMALRALASYVAWVSRPIANLLLTVHPDARPALCPAARDEGLLAGVNLIAILACLLAVPLWKPAPATVGLFEAVLMLSVLASVYSCPQGWPRQLLGACALVVLALGAYAFTKLAIWLPDWTGWEAFRLFLLGTIIIDVGALVLRRVRPRRADSRGQS